MTVEWIEKDGKQFQILYGFGRLQKARSIYAKYLPESMKRAQITNVDISDDELIKKAAPDELLFYNEHVSMEICALVLHEAPDWDKSKLTVSDYVDGYLPDDVGLEILKRIRAAIEGIAVTEDQKKP